MSTPSSIWGLALMKAAIFGMKYQERSLLIDIVRRPCGGDCDAIGVNTVRISSKITSAPSATRSPVSVRTILFGSRWKRRTPICCSSRRMLKETAGTVMLSRPAALLRLPNLTTRWKTRSFFRSSSSIFNLAVLLACPIGGNAGPPIDGKMHFSYIHNILNCAACDARLDFFGCSFPGPETTRAHLGGWPTIAGRRPCPAMRRKLNDAIQEQALGPLRRCDHW